MFDIEKIRKDFKILDSKVYGRNLVYMDNAATTQKPECVINTLSDYYRTLNSNIHRGVHYLSSKATTEFEETRHLIKSFINAGHSREIIFTRGTTESINLVASSFGKTFLNQGDEVVISEMEHHSNIVPWQMICEERGAKLRIIPFDEKGELIFSAFKEMLSPKTKLVAVAHISNALGTVNPVREIIREAHRFSVPVLVDGAQAVAHTKVDVQNLDCDFYCFSGHKMYAPMGVGVLYGKEEWLNKMPPYQGGGEMIKEVRFDKTTYNELPFKFEAGTPSVGDILGLKTAIEYMNSIGMSEIEAYEEEILNYATQKLSAIKEIRFIGTAKEKAGVISFLLGEAHPYDVGTLLDQLGVAVRTGHHCAQPVMDHFGIPGTVRASFGLYTNKQDIDILVDSIERIKPMVL